ncbi:LmbU family transcriptional regulator [Streptomyces sp. NPDC059070]|uniref:LmbU family transcriptional regulator n=1 Tax=Streptomyces sp. NPDC059070 TaxID=3346713 RepID=UPI00368E9943
MPESPAATPIDQCKPSARDRLGFDGPVRALRTTLLMPENLPLSAWLRVGKQLGSFTNSSAWWAGDWLVYGDHTYPDRYRDAVERTSLDYQTLRNYAWVARKFAPQRRRSELSFQHHQEVAALPPDEQDAWLDRAVEAQWSKAELRRQIRRKPDGEEPPGVFRTRLQFELAGHQWVRWQEAADLDGGDVVKWLVKVADRAAVALPGPAAPVASVSPVGPVTPVGSVDAGALPSQEGVLSPV